MDRSRGPCSVAAAVAGPHPSGFLLVGGHGAPGLRHPRGGEALIARVILAGGEIRHNPGVFARMRDNWQKRIDKCCEQGGGHFQHLL